MRSTLKPGITLALATTLTCSAALAGTQTVGLFVNEPGASNGYTLFTSLGGTVTYLIDINGQQVNSWESAYPPGNSHYILDNGHLLRAGDPRNNSVFAAGGDAGIVEEYDWDGDIVWSYLYSNNDHRAHHDIAPMPNGNVLIVAWEFRSGAESIQAGRNPANLPAGELWPEHVVEVEPVGTNGGNIVWEWHMWDHLIQDFDDTKDNFGVIADHPELIDINHHNSASADWIHANAIDYNPQLDQILINSPFLGEFWIIDHSTMTAEAAGHTGGNSGMGGDILYRWGNPQAYDRGTSADRKFYNQHDAHWIDAGLPGGGNIIVFNNGQGRPEGAFTTIEELVPPVSGSNYTLDPGLAYGPAAPTYLYMADPATDFYSSFISGVQRQPNGNTLICAGAWGDFFEVTPADDVVWRYVSPVLGSGPMTQGDPIPPQGANSTANRAFRAERYPPNHPGLVGQDLSPKGLIEICPATCSGDVTGGPGGCPDGEVNVTDLVTIILNWGTGGPGADLEEPLDVVDVSDLIAVILAWGTCP